MLNAFPEISEFFRQDSFTEEDLNYLINQLKDSYADQKIYNKAVSLIELYLLKFRLSTPEELEQFKRNGIKQKRVRKSPKTKRRITRSQKSDNNNTSEEISNYNLKFLNIPLVDICEDLNISMFRIDKILEKNDLKPIIGGVLNEDQLMVLKGFLVSKLEAKERKQKKERWVSQGMVKRTNTKRPKTGGKIYESLSKYGIGKVIYIRSK